MRLGWYSELTAPERRTFWACFGGFGLDSMDTTMYALVIPSLIAMLGITRPEAGYLATAALVGAAIGGWGAGVLADRIGRVRVLQLTILWVAGFTFVAAFTGSFSQLLVVRLLQGLGYGGEAAVGGVLISEVVRPALRGRVAASVQSGYAAMPSRSGCCRWCSPCSRRRSVGACCSRSASSRRCWCSSYAGWCRNRASTPRLAPEDPPGPPSRRSGPFLPAATCGTP
jgi:hypothetical protein